MVICPESLWCRMDSRLSFGACPFISHEKLYFMISNKLKLRFESKVIGTFNLSMGILASKKKVKNFVFSEFWSFFVGHSHDPCSPIIFIDFPLFGPQTQSELFQMGLVPLDSSFPIQIFQFDVL